MRRVGVSIPAGRQHDDGKRRQEIDDQPRRMGVSWLRLARMTGHGTVRGMQTADPKKRLLGHVVGLGSSALMVGIFFMQALYEGLRGNPLAYLYVLGVIALSVVVFIHGRRILREGPPTTNSDA